MVSAFAAASGRPIPYELAPRRAGDVAQCYADPVLAATELGWRAEKDQTNMCRDHWHWQSRNPMGYGD